MGYRWVEVIKEQQVERREVRVPGGGHLFNVHKLPGPWRQWLTKTREDPPTEEELLKLEQKQQALRQRVAALEAAEAARRFRAASLGQQATAAGGPTVDSFVHELGERGFGQGKDK